MSPLWIFGIFALGAGGLWGGMHTWRGKEHSYVVEHQRKHGPHSTPTFQGGVRLYQTSLGAGFTAIPGGVGFMLFAVAETIRQILGHDTEGALMWGASSITVALLGISFLWTGAYLWIGIPDWMRPPAQRGWANTKKGYILARPEALVEEEEPPAYDPAPWAEGEEPEMDDFGPQVKDQDKWS